MTVPHNAAAAGRASGRRWPPIQKPAKAGGVAVAVVGAHGPPLVRSIAGVSRDDVRVQVPDVLVAGRLVVLQHRHSVAGIPRADGERHAAHHVSDTAGQIVGQA